MRAEINSVLSIIATYASFVEEKEKQLTFQLEEQLKRATDVNVNHVIQNKFRLGQIVGINP